MKPLKTRFNRDGFKHEQIKREGNLAIFERSKELNGKTIMHYEVVKIRVSRAHEAYGAHFEECEYYPSSEDWGTYGWTCQDRESAQERFTREQRKLNAE